MNTKIILSIGTVLAAGALLAGPHHGGFGGPRGGFGGPCGPVMHAPRGPAFRPAPMHRPPPPPPRIHHHGGYWGHGGRSFWPGFVGGVVGGVITDALIAPAVAASTIVASTPVIAPAPVYTSQQVWVPGGYVDQVQPNGTVIRVWQPGHYETRQVYVP